MNAPIQTLTLVGARADHTAHCPPDHAKARMLNITCSACRYTTCARCLKPVFRVCKLHRGAK
jgi:hypothetical protein